MRPMMKRTLTIAVLALGLVQLSAQPGRAGDRFLGIDADNGNVYYNGRNSGRYCVYRTVEVFNRVTGYMENRRVRRCGRGLYVR